MVKMTLFVFLDFYRNQLNTHFLAINQLINIIQHESKASTGKRK